MEWITLTLRSTIPSGESYYSAESGATIEKGDGGFWVSARDSRTFWTPDSNVVAAFPRD